MQILFMEGVDWVLALLVQVQKHVNNWIVLFANDAMLCNNDQLDIRLDRF